MTTRLQAARDALSAIVAVRAYLTTAKAEADAAARMDRAALASVSLGDAEREWLDIALRASTDSGRRHHIYLIGVISLYGSMERYVESLVSEHVRYLNGAMTRFSDLPEPVQKQHTRLTLEVLRLHAEQRYPRSLNAVDTLDNLRACLDGAAVRLNEAAFAYHSSNCWARQITSLLGQVGVTFNDATLTETSAFRSYWQMADGSATAEPKAADAKAWLTRHVDELVQRRNEVAHGYDTDDLESVEILVERTDALAVLVNALDEAVSDAVSEIEIQSGRAMPLQRVLRVFDNRIVGVEVSGVRVRRGDTLIAKLPSGGLRHRRGEILSIEIDKEDFAEVQPSTPTAVALRVEFFAKDNFDYFLLPQ